MMSSLMGSHRVAALATAMAVSGTVVLLALCRQRPFPSSPLRSYISSEERKRERADSNKKKNKRKKRVHFAAQPVELPGENSARSNDDEEENDLIATLPPETVQARKGDEARRVRGMPANRVALYNGILQDRLRRMAGSY